MARLLGAESVAPIRGLLRIESPDFPLAHASGQKTVTPIGVQGPFIVVRASDAFCLRRLPRASSVRPCR